MESELLRLADAMRKDASELRSDQNEAAALALEEHATTLSALATRSEGGRAVACYGMRRKGTEEIIGIIPNKIAAIPAKSDPYLAEFEEVPLYTEAPAGDARDSLRLDWLDANGCGQFCRSPHDKPERRWFDADTRDSDYSPTLREAIDAAIDLAGSE